GNAVRLAQGLEDLLFGAGAQIEEDFTNQLLVVRAALLFERALDDVAGHGSAADKDLPERFTLSRCKHQSLRMHGSKGHREVRVTFQAVLEPRDLEYLAAVLSRGGKLDPSEALLAAALEP